MIKIHFLNVGEGDCTIIEHEDEKISVIDICNGNLTDEDKTDPIAYLRKIQNLQYGDKGEIFRFILTHPDMDHMDGIERLYKNFEIINFWDSDHAKTMESISDEGGYSQEDWDFYDKVHKKTKKNITRMELYKGCNGEYYTNHGIKIISPNKELVQELKDKENPNWNDISYVLLFETHGKKILFCGDSGNTSWKHIIGNKKTREDIQKKNLVDMTNEEKEIIKNIKMLKNIDILFAPHHGRKSGGDNLNEYLDFLNPKLAILGSAKSKHKNYEAFNKRKIPLLTNDEAGNIVFGISDLGISISCKNKTLTQILKSKGLENIEYLNAWQDTLDSFGININTHDLLISSLFGKEQ